MKKIDSLVTLLSKQQADHFIPAHKLAEMLGVTDRTIRSYVHELNEAVPHRIESSKSGYRLTTVSQNDTQHETGKSDRNLRRFHILRQLCNQGTRGVDLYALAEALYVSDATIRSDLASLSLSAKGYSLQIYQKSGRYFLTGPKKEKRHYILALMSPENAGALSFNQELQTLLGETDLTALRQLVSTIFSENKLVLNTYFYENFMLHLVLAIDHSKEQKPDASNIAQAVGLSSDDKATVSIMTKICQQLHAVFQISLWSGDITELTTLCQLEFRCDDKKEMPPVDPELALSLHMMLSELSEVYVIDFSDQHVRKQLIYHIQKLYHRARQQQFSRNFSLLAIKVKYPILFDIAVYMTSLLSKQLKIMINEDEIAFLALHLGTFIDHQQADTDGVIKTVIITPSYLQMPTAMITKILDHFSGKLVIAGVYDDFSQIDLINQSELILTSIPESESSKEIDSAIVRVQIKEFMTSRDLNKIYRGIEQVYQNHYVMFLTETLPILMPSESYLDIVPTLSRSTIFEQIGAYFTAHQFVNETYTRELAARESLSTTAFPSQIAIPHPIKYDALKTGLFVLNPRGMIDWGGRPVQLVVAFAIKQSDAQLFNRIFPRFIEIVSEVYHVNYLSSSENRKQFIDRLIELLISDGYYQL